MKQDTHHKNHVGTKFLNFLVFLAIAVLLVLFGKSVKNEIIPEQKKEEKIEENYIETKCKDSSPTKAMEEYAQYVKQSKGSLDQHF